MRNAWTRRLALACLGPMAITAIAFIALVAGSDRQPVRAAGLIPIVFNMDTSGDAAPNTTVVATPPNANTLGPVVSCVQIPVGGITTIDLTVRAPGLQGEGGPTPGTLAGFGYNLLFDGTVVEVTAAAHDFLLTAGNPQGGAIDLASNTFPNTSGNMRFDEANLSGGGQTGTGVGVLTRLTIQGLASGTTNFTIQNASILDDFANDYVKSPGVTIASGAVAVGTAICPTPTPSPTPTPVPTPTPTPVPIGNTTAVFLDSQPGDYIGLGQQLTFYPLCTKCLTAQGSPSHVEFSLNSGGHWFYLDFASPGGQTLSPGDYENAERWPFQSVDAPGLSIDGDGRGCNTLTGRFIVKEAVFAFDGTPALFSASFEQHCEGGAAALFGEIRYQSTVDFRADLASPSQVQFPPQPVGTTSPTTPVQVTNTGSEDLHISGYSLASVNPPYPYVSQPPDFSVQSDGCSGTTLAPTASCTLELQFSPTVAGTQAAQLQISLDTFRGNVVVTMLGTGTTPHVVFNPSGRDFYWWEIGVASSPQPFTLTNQGLAPLLLNSMSITGLNAGDFQITNTDCPETILPGGNCTIWALFRPSAVGPRSGFLTIADNAPPDSQHSVPLAGTGYAVADLSIGLGANPVFVKTGKPLTYTITVTNFGPDGAGGVVLTDVLPSTTQFASINLPQGTCTTPPAGQAGTVNCILGAIPAGASLTVTLVVKVVAPGRTVVTDTASVATSMPYYYTDPVASNNSASASVAVFGRR